MSAPGKIPSAPEEYGALTPRQFERLVAVCWEAHGWRCAVLPKGADRGVDVVATRTDPVRSRHLIQVKRRPSEETIGAPIVRNCAGMYRYDADVNSVALVTSGRFTTPAREAAAETGVRLVAGDALTRLVMETTCRFTNETMRWLLRGGEALLRTIRIPAVRPTPEPRFGAPSGRVEGSGAPGVGTRTSPVALGRQVGKRVGDPRVLSVRTTPGPGASDSTTLTLYRSHRGILLALRYGTVQDNINLVTLGRRASDIAATYGDHVPEEKNGVCLRFEGGTSIERALEWTIAAAGTAMEISESHVLHIVERSEDDKQVLYRHSEGT